VTFYDGTTLLGTASLNAANGSGVFSTTSLAVGAHSITATYQGDSNFAASTSSAIQVQVNAAPSPDFSLSTSVRSQTVTPGQSADYMLTLTPQNGFSQAVSISCSGGPAKAACTPASSSVTLNGTSAQQVAINVSTVAPSLAHPVSRPFTGRRTPAVIASFLLLCLLIADRFNRHSIAVRRWLVGAAFAVVIGLAFVGCAGNNSTTPADNGTPAGNYTLTITGTSGSTTHTITVSLVVQ
jgi:hypothetical protein